MHRLKQQGLFLLLLALSAPIRAEEMTAIVTIDAQKVQGEIHPFVYGQQLEVMGNCVDGGIWAELLRNRRFDLQDDNGDGVSDPWLAVGAPHGARFSLEHHAPFSGKYSQKLVLQGPSDQPRGLRQPQQRILSDRSYRGSVFLKGENFDGKVLLALANGPRALYALATIEGIDSRWRKYEFTLRPNVHDPSGDFLILFQGTGTVWLDAASLMPADHQSGMVRGVVSLLEAARTPTIRFPGGCYADVYHFEQALGDRDRRAMTWDPMWRKWDANDFGTDEFLALCRILDAEPNLTVNFGSGTPQEAANWVQYCNGSVDTPYGRKRAQNGHPEPYGVKYWSIGNELWGCGGPFTAQAYAEQLPDWAAAMKAVDPSIVLAVNGGPRGWPPEQWDAPLVPVAAEHVQWYTLHDYFPGPVAPIQASEEEIYRAIVGNPVALERSLLDFSKKIRSWGNGRKLELLLDEWNVMIPNGRLKESPDPYGHIHSTPERRARDEAMDGAMGGLVKFTKHLQNTDLGLREGLYASGIFHLFYRLSDVLLGGNVFSSVNLMGAIETNGLETYATPVALAYQLYSRHSGKKVIETRVRVETYDATLPGRKAKKEDIPYLDVVATLTEDGRRLYLHAINRHIDRPIRARIELAHFSPAASGKLYQLGEPDLAARNDFLHPAAVRIREDRFRTAGRVFEYVFPAHSATTLQLENNE